MGMGMGMGGVGGMNQGYGGAGMGVGMGVGGYAQPQAFAAGGFPMVGGMLQQQQQGYGATAGGYRPPLVPAAGMGMAPAASKPDPFDFLN